MSPGQMSNSEETCLVCRAIWASLQAIYDREEASIGAQSDVIIQIQGPYYLREVPFLSDFNSLPKDLMDDNPVIPLFFKIDVTKDGESDLHITPQFKFHYSQHKTPSYLRQVELWDVNHFDVTLLRDWISRCDSVHGRRCKEIGATVGAKIRGIAE